jgi:hypothetical protein
MQLQMKEKHLLRSDASIVFMKMISVTEWLRKFLLEQLHLSLKKLKRRLIDVILLEHYVTLFNDNDEDFEQTYQNRSIK